MAHITYYCFLFSKALRMALSTLIGAICCKLWGVKTTGIIRCFGVPHIEKEPGSDIVIGRNCILRSARYANIAGINRPVMLAARFGGRIEIGNDCGLSGTVIVSETSVKLGQRVMTGVNCTIADTDFHPVDAELRAVPHSRGKSLPIVIEDDVFIGMNSMILKGCHIGKGAVIAAGSVVTHDVPAGTVFGGVPAKQLSVTGH